MMFDLVSSLASAYMRPVCRGAALAWVAALWVVAGQPITGYHAYGQDVTENILNSVQHPIWAVAWAHMMVAIFSLGGGWQTVLCI